MGLFFVQYEAHEKEKENSAKNKGQSLADQIDKKT
jgi:hypothetical protein